MSWRACRALVALGAAHGAPHVVPLLLHGDDAQGRGRYYACKAIARLGRDGGWAAHAGAVAACLGDGWFLTPPAACGALAALGAEACRPHAAALAACLHGGQDYWVCAHACEPLALCGELAEAHVPRMRQILPEVALHWPRLGVAVRAALRALGREP